MNHDRPHILYLHCHDAGRYIQPYGHAVSTPSLQRLAEQGVLFRQAFTTSPTCSPSRACLLTGQHAHRTGMLGLAHRGFAMRDYSRHIIHTLHAAGYTSALAGVQHIAPKDEAATRIGYQRVLTTDTGFAGCTEAAIDFLHEPQPQPFFLSVGYFAPHRAKVAHRPPQSFPALGPAADERYVRPPAPLPDTPQTRRDMAEYSAGMTSTDLCMGRVLEALDRTGLADHTLVIATTDHGIAFPAMKCTLTDHGMGVMLIVRGPRSGPFRGGKVIDAMVSHLDLFPTVCQTLRLPTPDDLDGRSLLPLVAGETETLHDELFAQVNHHAAYQPLRAVRTREWKYVRRMDNHPGVVLPNCDDSLSKTYWHRLGWADRTNPREWLFNLRFDPNEAENLAADPACDTVLRELRGRLDAWMHTTDDPILRGPIPLPPGGVTTPTDAYSP